MSLLKKIYLVTFLVLCEYFSYAQIIEMWDKSVSSQNGDDKTKWFQDAKFGLFVHWGLFAQHAGVWKQKRYYGISEWVMNRGKIPAADYRKLAQKFNPSKFNADEWVKIINDAGIKYMVITAKHHDGFAMFESKASGYNIMNTPFKRDPMKELSLACQKGDVKLGFYYSQFLDWNEPNGGGNEWDFIEKNKDYKAYYNSKSIPQIKELLSNYGPLGLIWFDMPGGLNKEETQSLIDDARKIQPNCLLSSRVGQGLGDFRDFGDGEVPSTVVKGPWEAIFTHNDSWGFSEFDHNFKSPTEIINLLVSVVSKGGNLMLNVGPKADGTIPEVSVKCLKAVGDWLKINGESIYGTSHGPIGPQPWGVTTLKPTKLFLHVKHKPSNGLLQVPGLDVKIKQVSLLSNKKKLHWKKEKNILTIKLPTKLADNINSVIVVDYDGQITESYLDAPVVISPRYPECSLEVIKATPLGNTKIVPVTHSLYFGDWKHTTCATDMRSTTDGIIYNVQFAEPGEYKITLEYNCSIEDSKQEGLLQVGDQKFYFETLGTGSYDTWRPLMFIRHSVAMISVASSGEKTIKVAPVNESQSELFKLSKIIIEPVK